MVGNDGGNCGVIEIVALLPKVVVLLMMVTVKVIVMVTQLHISC